MRTATPYSPRAAYGAIELLVTCTGKTSLLGNNHGHGKADGHHQEMTAQNSYHGRERPHGPLGRAVGRRTIARHIKPQLAVPIDGTGSARAAEPVALR